MSRALAPWLAWAALVACQAPPRANEHPHAASTPAPAHEPAHEPAHAHEHAHAEAKPAPAPATAEPAPTPGTPEHFGAPFAEGITAVSLGALIKSPNDHNGQIVETEGTVSQVCQAAGCWMELTDAASGERVRTPMAGHAFFLPRTVVGKRARVQGRVELIALSDAAKQHLEAEGAQATSSKLSLSALAVSVQ